MARFDVASGRIVARATFPDGSKPWMLRASPDGAEVWVQTESGTNTVLDAATMQVLHTEPVGREPVQGAFTPDGRFQLTAQLGEDWLAVTDRRTYQLVARLTVGPGAANIAFSPDGRLGYVTVTGADRLAVVDLARLEVTGHIATGRAPMGLAVYPPPAPAT